MWAVIPAAGSGSRLGGKLAKQFREIAGRTVLEHVLVNVLKHPEIDGVMLVHSASAESSSSESNTPLAKILALPWQKPVRHCAGGATRADSVLCGLRALHSELSAVDLVAVHDAARPCVNSVDLTRLFVVAKQHAVGAILAEAVADTLKQVDMHQQIVQTLDRNTVWRAQTPQVFRYAELCTALEWAKQQNIAVTDEAHAMELLGKRAQIVAGDPRNLKITIEQDLFVAEQILLAALERSTPAAN
jgi:2-C-methyl-D-erythritol 4-phosphate cytidylyltransferase